MSGAGLRFGVACAGRAVERVYSIAVEKLVAVEGVEPVLTIAAVEEKKPAAPPALLARLFPPERVPCRQMTALPEKLAAAPCVSSTDRAAIPGDLDFILDFTAGGLDCTLAGIPRYGVWRLRFGEHPEGQPFFEELHSGSTIAMSRLQATGGGAPLVLETAAVNTVPWSWLETMETAMLAGAELPAMACKRLLGGGDEYFRNAGAKTPAPLSGGSAWDRNSKPIGGGTALAFSGKVLAAWAASQAGAIFRFEMWDVGVVAAPIARFLEPGFRPQVSWMPRPEGLRFVADPFGFAAGDALTLLMEEFDYRRYQGYITAVEFRDGKFSTPRVAIDERVHMSYPFPLFHHGERYCIPESRRSREVAVYRYGNGAWERVRTIIRDFAALDSTVIQHEGRWWLFCTDTFDYPEAKLYIWFADDLLGEWQPHPLNPVKCDVRSSRPGGTPFWHQGRLYRPAQDSSRSYGGGLTINRVLRLTTEDFAEEPVVSIAPLPARPHGIHTLSAAGEYTLVDGKRMEFTPPLMRKRLLHKVKRIGQVLTGQAPPPATE